MSCADFVTIITPVGAHTAGSTATAAHQFEPEHAAFGGPARDADLPSHQTHELQADGQTETRAPHSSAALTDLLKRLEKRAELISLIPIPVSRTSKRNRPGNGQLTSKLTCRDR